MNRLQAVLSVLVAVAMGVLLYFLTVHDSQQDPCATPQNDISASILSDDRDDQDALANRAILQRGACKPKG